ncbi:MAG TPA: hypothetical protein VI277_04585, partial [Candidatus Limnocylindria bacterium]
LFPVGATTVTCSAADGTGNVATAAFVVEIAAAAVPEPDLDGSDTDTEPADPAPATNTPAGPEPSAPTDQAPAPSTDEATAGASNGPRSAEAATLPDTSMRLPASPPTALGLVLLAIATVWFRRRPRTLIGRRSA